MAKKFTDLKAFREEHLHKLNDSMKHLDAIIKQKPEQRVKCPKCKEYYVIKIGVPSWVKNKIEAIKTRARHLGALQPEKETKAAALAAAAAVTKVENLDTPLTSDEQDELDAYIDNENQKMVS